MHHTRTQTRTPRKLQPKPMPSYDRLDHERSPKTPTTATTRTHNHSSIKNPQVINSNSLPCVFNYNCPSPQPQAFKRAGIITCSKRKLISSELADPHASNAANMEVVGAKAEPLLLLPHRNCYDLSLFLFLTAVLRVFNAFLRDLKPNLALRQRRRIQNRG